MALHGPEIAENRPDWYDPIGILSFSISLALNTILTGLLVFKIAKASLALRRTHARGVTDFTSLISILIESGLVLFMAQLIWVVCFSLKNPAFNLVSGPITMIYVRAYLRLPLLLFNLFLKGIIPTTIVVRVAMARACTANTTGNNSSNLESIQFAFTDE